MHRLNIVHPRTLAFNDVAPRSHSGAITGPLC